MAISKRQPSARHQGRAAAKGVRRPAKARAYKPSKPQALKKELRQLTRSGLLLPSRRRKPHVYRTGAPGAAAGLVLGQAPPAPRASLPRGWRPLAGPAEQRLAKLAGMASPQDFWAEFDRANLLSWYPGLQKRPANQDVSKGYRLHQSDGDIFPMEDARRAASSLDLGRYVCVILLGNNVARAFGFKAGLLETEVRGTTRLLSFPHPSGVSHFWNDATNRQHAAKVLKSALQAMRRARSRRAHVHAKAGA